MSRTLETTLLSLVPTYPSASSLPRPLVDLASSLLTQSRHNASTLKAEEEVAREHACAHLACERLKTSLDLPPIQARPPVPPRIYKRLYTHLDHILPANTVGKSGRVRTPSSKLREAQQGGGLFGSTGGGSIERTHNRGTPSKETSLAQFRSRTDGTPTKSSAKKGIVTPAKRKADGDRDVLPPWIRPTIQFLCTQMNQSRIGRIILAGMETIVLPRGRRTTDEWVNSNLTPLLAGIAFLTVWQIISLETEETDLKAYAKARDQVLKTVLKARDVVEVKGVEDEDAAWEGWSDIKTKDIDKTVEKGTKSGWQESGWFGSIRDMVDACGTGKGNKGASNSEDGGGEDEVDDEVMDRMQMQRGDSMFQGRWVMTDRKREEYRHWKEDIMVRIEEIQREQEYEMDVDEAA
ncbi:origin recognition complex subunit 6 [Apiospora phragmitis]|uniref:Origin recognition complex subunit 6 n=1 Tax=Apiospora phragmitis TaxID=2905665 RepID=A0ABR1WW45_9PEZI